MSRSTNRPAMRLHLPVWLRGGVLALSLVGIGLLLDGLGFTHLFERAWIDAHVRGHGARGYGLFLAAGTLTTAIGLPRQIVAFFGGYAFGVVPGVLLSSAAALAGCVLSFLYARLLGRDLVLRAFPGRLRRFDEVLREQPFAMTLAVRLMPVGSNLATNLIAGVSAVPAPAFFVGSLLGYLPQTLVFAMAGSGVVLGSRWQIAASIVLLIVSGLLGARVYRRARREGAAARDRDVAAGPDR